LEVFDPSLVKGKEVAVVGLGATGSAMALTLAKNGILPIIIDHDLVEERNISNQYIYAIDDVGRPKVFACKDRIKQLTGYDVPSVWHRLISRDLISRTGFKPNIVFLCVDDMDVRKDIVDGIIFGNGITDLVIDIRIGLRQINILSFNPANLKELKAWREEWFPQSEAVQEVGKCGINLTMGPTAQLAANLAMWNFIYWAKQDSSFQNEVILTLYNWNIMKRKITL
jgi:hypothetical protein